MLPSIFLLACFFFIVFFFRFTPQVTLAYGHSWCNRRLQQVGAILEVHIKQQSYHCEIFLIAVQNFRLQSRVRSDQGLENMLVARHMIEKRGSELRSMLTGSSTHNQRIERLWRDMHSCVTLLYYRLFYYLEQMFVGSPEQLASMGFTLCLSP